MIRCMQIASTSSIDWVGFQFEKNECFREASEIAKTSLPQLTGSRKKRVKGSSQKEETWLTFGFQMLETVNMNSFNFILSFISPLDLVFGVVHRWLWRKISHRFGMWWTSVMWSKSFATIVTSKWKVTLFWINFFPIQLLLMSWCVLKLSIFDNRH